MPLKSLLDGSKNDLTAEPQLSTKLVQRKAQIELTMDEALGRHAQ